LRPISARKKGPGGALDGIEADGAVLVPKSMPVERIATCAGSCTPFSTKYLREGLSGVISEAYVQATIVRLRDGISDVPTRVGPLNVLVERHSNHFVVPTVFP